MSSHNRNNAGMERTKGFVVGLLLGSAIGAGAALLNAPQTGKRTRRQLKRKATKLQKQAKHTMEDAQDRVHETREHVMEQAEEAQKRAEAVREDAEDRAEELKEKGNEMVKEGKKRLSKATR